MNLLFRKTQATSILKMLGAFFFLALMASGVYAQTGAAPLSVDQLNAATPAGDLSTSMWKFLLGDFATSPFSALGSPHTLLGGMFVIFNIGIFSIGMIYVTYGVGSGIIGTANDGQALGQRINTAWYPIRVLTGISGLVPIFSGFTGSQAIIMWIGTLGIGMANMMWSGAVNNTYSQQLINTGDPVATAPAAARQTASDLFVSHVCLWYYRDLQRKTLNEGITLSRPEIIDEPGTWFFNSSYVMNFGPEGAPTVCGTFRIDQADGANLTGATTRGAVSGTGAFRAGSVDYSGISSSVLRVYKNAATQLNSDMERSAIAWVVQRETSKGAGTSPPIPSKEIDAAVATFQKTVNDGVTSSSVKDQNAINASAQSNMLQWGWMAAGSWYATFAEVNTAIAEAVKATKIGSTPPNLGQYAHAVAGTVSQAVADVRVAMATYNSSQSGDSASIQNVLKDSGCGFDALNSVAGTATGNCSLGQAIVSRAIKASVNGVSLDGSNVMIAGAPLINPVIMMKNIGDYAMTFGTTAIIAQEAVRIAAETAEAGSEVISGIPLVGGMVGGAIKGTAHLAKNLVPSWMMTGAWVILGIGALMSLYIPMIPFIVWMGGVIGYAASFIEGLVAMPLHSFSHLDTDGEGMGQRTGHGYLFLLNTFARPSLMVMAFFVASALMIVIGTFQAALFLPAMASAQGNSITGLFSVIGYMLIFFVMNTTLINACFELITVIPDQVIGFVGAGSVNTHLGRDAEQKINGIFVAAVRTGRSELLGPKASGVSPKKLAKAPTP